MSLLHDFMELSITSVDQSPVEMGRIAAQVFLEEVGNGKKIKTAETSCFNTRIND